MKINIQQIFQDDQKEGYKAKKSSVGKHRLSENFMGFFHMFRVQRYTRLQRGRQFPFLSLFRPGPHLRLGRLRAGRRTMYSKSPYKCIHNYSYRPHNVLQMSSAG